MRVKCDSFCSVGKRQALDGVRLCCDNECMEKKHIPRMAGAYRRLTHRQRRFVQALTETNDTRESALLANYASEATGATLVRSNRDIRAILAFQAQGAVDRIETLSINAENEGVRLNANKDIMDRAGYKPIEQVQNTTINLEVRQPNTEELETIRLKYERELYNKLAEPKQNE